MKSRGECSNCRSCAACHRAAPADSHRSLGKVARPFKYPAQVIQFIDNFMRKTVTVATRIDHQLKKIPLHLGRMPKLDDLFKDARVMQLQIDGIQALFFKYQVQDGFIHSALLMNEDADYCRGRSSQMEGIPVAGKLYISAGIVQSRTELFMVLVPYFAPRQIVQSIAWPSDESKDWQLGNISPWPCRILANPITGISHAGTREFYHRAYSLV